MTSYRWKKEWYALCNPPKETPADYRARRKKEIEWEHRGEWMNEWAQDKSYKKSFSQFSSDKAEALLRLPPVKPKPKGAKTKKGGAGPNSCR